MTVKKLNQIWWVSLTVSKYAPLLKRRIVYISDSMVMLGLPDINDLGDCRKAYILDSVRFIEEVCDDYTR